MSDNLKPVMFRLEPDVLDELRSVAAREERTISQTIRRAIKMYLKSVKP